MLKRLINFQTKNITLSAGILFASSLVSDVLSLVSSRLLAGHFGATPQLDIYFAAFRIPDFIYNILISGGVIVAFMPLFSEYFLKDKEDAWRFANNVLNVFAFFLVAFALFAAALAPFLLKIITPGFKGSELSSAILLTRILLLSPILLGLSSIFSGILQYFRKFFVYSLAPIFYNLGIISGIIFLSPHFGIMGVAFGVIIGAFLHASVQIPSAVHTGFSYKFTLKINDQKIKRVFLLMFPRTLGVAVPQINLIVATAIASTLAAGDISIFTIANTLQLAPTGLIGVPFAIAAFPALTRAWASRKVKSFWEDFKKTFWKIICLAVPLSILIFIFRNQIIDIIYRTGRFTQVASSLTAASLGLFSLGIFASCLAPLIFRAFFSMQDTKTPTIIAVFAMILNVGFCFLFVWLLSFPNGFHNFITSFLSLPAGIKNIAIVGLPLAFAIDSVSEFILLIIFLTKKIKNKKFTETVPVGDLP